MPRSSRGSTSHRGHRARGKHTEPALQATQVATPQEIATQISTGDGIGTEQPVVQPARSDRIKKSTAQPATTTTPGTAMQANPLLTKELIRIAVLAIVVLVLLTTFTTLVK